MAAVSVIFDGTNISQAESASDSGTWDKWGTTQAPTQDTEMKIQNSTAQSNKISSTTGGVDFDDDITIDYVTIPKAVIARIICTTPGGIDGTVAKGMAYQVGSGPSDYHEYYLFGLYRDYPLIQSWLALAIDPNIAAYRDAQIGTPVLGSVDYYGIWIDMASSARAENIAHDTLNYFDVGTGLTLTGGDGANADGGFQDFIDSDEGTQNNRWGLVTTREGILYVLSVLTIGSSTETDFADSNKVIVFPDGLYDTGFCGIDVNLSNANSVVAISNCTFVGKGRGEIVRDFHTNDDVDGTNEEVDIVGHGYETGDYVDYSKESGTDSIGLTDGNDYWVRAVTVDSISFYITRQNAFSDTSRVDLTASGGSETHRLTKLTETRPDFEFIDTAGNGSIDGCALLNHNKVTFTSAASQDGGRIECRLLTQGSADVENVKIVTDSVPSIACLQDPVFGTTTDLHDAEFIQGGQGHALELDTATSYDLTNIYFSGYGANDTDSAAIDVTASSGTVTINVLGGDSPTYKTAGATVNIVVNPVSLAITVLDEEDLTVIEGAAVTLLASDDDDPLPFEDSISIVRSGSVATATHTAHGLSTGQKVAISGADQNEYNRIKTIIVTGADTYTFIVSGTPTTPATGTIVATAVVIDGVTNSSGIISDTRTYSANQNIAGQVLRGTIQPIYKGRPVSGEIDSSNGLSLTVLLTKD